MGRGGPLERGNFDGPRGGGGGFDGQYYDAFDGPAGPRNDRNGNENKDGPFDDKFVGPIGPRNEKEFGPRDAIKDAIDEKKGDENKNNVDAGVSNREEDRRRGYGSGSRSYSDSGRYGRSYN